MIGGRAAARTAVRMGAPVALFATVASIGLSGTPAHALSASPFDLTAVERSLAGFDRTVTGLERTLMGVERSFRAEDPIEVDWRTLAGLDYRTGTISEPLQKLNGKLIKVPGFMVPLEDGADGVNEFLLVPYFGACIHTPPPPPNQIIYVRMAKGEKVEVNYWDPIWMEGDLTIQSTDSPYGVVGHQMTGTKIAPYEWK
jgi:hypothetical protein